MNKTDRFILNMFLVGIVLLGILLISRYTDWDYVCTSWWRFSKTYMSSCLLMGYPIF